MKLVNEKKDDVQDFITLDKLDKKYKPKEVKCPVNLKHNGGDGGEYVRNYMSDYALAYNYRTY